MANSIGSAVPCSYITEAIGVKFLAKEAMVA